WGDECVGDVAAEGRGGIHEREVRAVGEVRVRLSGVRAAVELRDDVQHQRPADAVERKPLPDLGHEQHPEGRRMTERLRELGRRALLGTRQRTALNRILACDWSNVPRAHWCLRGSVRGRAARVLRRSIVYETAARGMYR